MKSTPTGPMGRVLGGWTGVCGEARQGLCLMFGKLTWCQITESFLALQQFPAVQGGQTPTSPVSFNQQFELQRMGLEGREKCMRQKGQPGPQISWLRPLGGRAGAAARGHCVVGRGGALCLTSGEAARPLSHQTQR